MNVGREPSRSQVSVIAGLMSSLMFLTPAYAHVDPSHGEPVGGLAFLSGVMHPLTGLDHLIVMIAIGILAAQQAQGGRWRIPAAFVSAMIAGMVIGRLSGPAPMVEIAIFASVLMVIGLIVAARMKATPRTGGLIMLGAIGAIGVAHGVPHGFEGGGSNWPAFAAGAIVTTIALIGTGMVGALAWLRRTE